VAFRAVLDANVLYPFSLRDTLLRLAELELYDPLWSAQILDEATRNLVEDGRIEIWQAERLVEAMGRTFEAAEVPQAQVLALESAMLNDEKDRHVLAAAVAGGAEAVVTANLLDFPPEACDPLGVEAVHPDDFLLGLYRSSRTLWRTPSPSRQRTFKRRRRHLTSCSTCWPRRCRSSRPRFESARSWRNDRARTRAHTELRIPSLLLRKTPTPFVEEEDFGYGRCEPRERSR
jgi:predicted nucleic acid-binding protein